MRTQEKTGKIIRRLGAMLLAIVLAGALTAGASAASVTTVTVQMRPNVTILIDGVERTFYNVQGQQVHPIYYQGTHYLPVRAIGELMGKNVNWDQSTLTVTLSGTRTTTTQGTPDTSAKVQNISVQVRPDFTIIVDGTKRTFTDANKNVVYPMLYNGTTYLPVRAIGELMGKTVGWDASSMTITLTGSGSLVTDADSFGPSGPGNQTAQPGIISAETARAKALAHAGLTAGQVTFVKTKLEWDDGRQIYDVEFYGADYTEYDYEIDACTGAVLSFDYDADSYTPPVSNNGSRIGEEQAKSIALRDAGFTAAQVTRLRCKLEWDDGRWEYQVEFYKGTLEYEYEIDAYSGKILSKDVESIYD